MSAGATQSREAAYKDLLLRIHAMALDADAWQPALEAVTHHVGAEHALLFSPSSLPNAFPSATYDMDPEIVLEYATHWYQYDLWVHRAAEEGLTTTAAPILGDRLVPHREFVHSVIYNELLRRADAVRLMSAPIIAAETVQSPIPLAGAFLRSERRAPFGPAQARKYQEIIPHIAIAAKAYLQLCRARGTSRTWRTILDSATDGYIGLDDRLRVIEISPAAQAWLRSRTDILSVRAARLRANNSVSDDALLDRALRAARAGSRPPDSIQLGDLVRGRGVRLTILQVPPTEGELPGGPPLSVCVLIEGRRTHGVDGAQSRFALTTAETEVLRDLAEGLSPKRIASRREIAIKTVRHHLSKLFRKTGTANQRELLALIARI